MSSGLDLVSQLTPQNADQGLAKAPSTPTDAFSTAMNAAGFAPDDWHNARNAQSDRFQKISDDYFALKGERLLNPYDVSITRDEMRKYPNMPIPYVLQKRLADAREKTRIARDEVGDRGAVDPDFLNVDRINTSIAQTGEAMRTANEALVGTGQGVAQFLGGVVGGSVRPESIAAGLVPVSRLPMAAAEGIGRTFLGNVGREAALQGAVQGGAAAVGEAVGYGTRAQFGTAPTAGEITQNILGATIGGAVFGGTIRATHLGISRLIHGPQVEIRPGEYSPAIDVPQTVKDAQVVMQTGVLYGGMNKLGVPEPVHDRAYLSALNDVVAGHGAAIDMELPYGSAAAARTSHPALMVQHDALTTTIDDIRARLNPTDETIAHLRGQVDEINTRIREAGPQTQEQAALLGGVARAREIELQEAIARQAALAKGEAVETPYTASLRQQLLDAQDDLRALSPQMKEALGPDIMTRLAEEKALPPQAAQAAEGAPPVPAAEAEQAVADARLQGAAAAEAPLPPMSQWQRDNMKAAVDLADKLGLTDELRSLAEQGNLTAKQISEQLGGRLSPEEVRAVRDSLGIEAIGPAQAFGVPIPGGEPKLDPVLQRLVDEVRNPPVEEGRPDFAAAATPTKPEEVVPKTAAVQNEEAKAVIAEAQALIERPDREVPRPLREALAQATDDEAEAAIAVACIAGGGAL